MLAGRVGSVSARGGGAGVGSIRPASSGTREWELSMVKRVCTVGWAAIFIGVFAGAATASAAQYVGLGDSYSSGVGTRVFYSESGSCKRSPEAYAPKVAAAKGYTLNFEACSGAKTTDVNSNQLG